MQSKPDGKPQTRAQVLIDAGKNLPLPQIIGGAYLQEALLECGPTEVAFGEAPLAYSEIEAYGRLSGGLAPKEVRTIREMSKAYLITKQQAGDPFYVPPWNGDD